MDVCPSITAFKLAKLANFEPKNIVAIIEKINMRTRRKIVLFEIIIFKILFIIILMPF